MLTIRSVLCLFVLFLPPLHAQSVAVPPGTRVRMQPPCGAKITGPLCRPVAGRLLIATGDSVVIEDAQGVTRRINLATGSHVERSVGYRRHTLLGLGIGSLAGLVTGAALVSDCQREAQTTRSVAFTT